MSHISAGMLWNLWRGVGRLIHVTTANRRNPQGLRVHRVRSLHAGDRDKIDRIPVTSLSRTLLDLADVLQIRQLIRVIEQAERIGKFDLRAIDELCGRSNGRRVKTLYTAVSASGGPPLINSEWERDLWDFCDDHGIPRPQLNVLAEGYLVDALWRHHRLIVELDSHAYHRSQRAFNQDRAKYADLQLAGYLVLPLTRLDRAAARKIKQALQYGPSPASTRAV